MDILKLLLIAHLIGDFFLQPVKLVEKKKNSIKGLIIHSLIYTLMITLVLLLFGNKPKVVVMECPYDQMGYVWSFHNNNIRFVFGIGLL